MFHMCRVYCPLLLCLYDVLFLQLGIWLLTRHVNKHELYWTELFCKLLHIHANCDVWLPQCSEYRLFSKITINISGTKSSKFSWSVVTWTWSTSFVNTLRNSHIAEPYHNIEFSDVKRETVLWNVPVISLSRTAIRQSLYVDRCYKKTRISWAPHYSLPC
jgi:hypothetical protein